MEAEKAVAKNSKLHAVLAGCNYPTIEGLVMKGCHNDVESMHKTLITTLRFDPKNIVVMMDKPGSKLMPSRPNILDQLDKMIRRAKSGDTLFFYFAGHGTLEESKSTGRLEPVIITCEDNNMTCMEFRELVDMVPKGATFTILSDSCNSGGLIDKEPIQVGNRHRLQDQSTIVPYDDINHANPRMITYEAYVAHLSSVTGLNSPDIGVHMLHMFGDGASPMYRLSPDRYPKPLKPDQGILLSGCETDESSYDDVDGNGKPCGAFTKIVQEFLKERKGTLLSNRQIVIRARKILGLRKDVQHPCLYCSKENADAVFLGKPGHRSVTLGESSSSQDA